MAGRSLRRQARDHLGGAFGITGPSGIIRDNLFFEAAQPVARKNLTG
jgi:hypothetical protein